MGTKELSGKEIARRDFLTGTGFVAVSAATVGSLGLLAGCSNEGTEGQPSTEAYDWEDSADVLVIGGGCGMMAAIEAVNAGAKVILLEKTSECGGDTKICGGVFYAAGTEVQEEMGIIDERTGTADTPASAAEDWKRIGLGTNNATLVDDILTRGPAIVKWFLDRGVEFILYQSGPEPVMRGHVNAPSVTDGIGENYTDVLIAEMESVGVTTYYNTKAVDILTTHDGTIIGVKAKASDGGFRYYGAKVVILAAGGPGANSEMTMKYNPESINWVNLSVPSHTGDGFIMSERLDAKFVGFRNKFDPSSPSIVIGFVYNPGHNDPDLITTYAYYFTQSGPKAFVLVDADGKRFVNESLGYAEGINQVIAQSKGSFAWCILDQTLYDDPAWLLYTPPTGSREALYKALEDGVITKAESIETLASTIGLDPRTLEQTVSDWNSLVTTGTDSQFGRFAGSLKAIETGPFYAYKIVPGAPSPFIGASISLDINEQCQVLDRDGDVIPGLYAVGAGISWHATLGMGYPGSGSSLAAGFACGQIAGVAAAAEALKA